MRTKTNLKASLVMAVILLGLCPAVSVAGIIYVDAGATGANNGTSWTDAYRYLQDALAGANAKPFVDEIRVAEGSYLPDANTAYPGGTGEREATFALISGVAVYGGFPSGGGSPESRKPKQYITILQGDINVPAYRADNSYHVVTAVGTDANTILDGFTITGGNAAGSFGGGMYVSGSLILANCTFTDNYATARGGGMYYFSRYGDRAAVVNCTFIGNWSDGDGGGISAVLSCDYGYGTEMTVTNCIFIHNWAGTSGGGIYLIQGGHHGDPVSEVVNCTFYGNNAADGGGIRATLWAGYGIVTNCILWMEWPDDIAGPGLEVNYCCLQHWDGDGVGNILTYPLFVDPLGPDLIPGTGDEDLRLGDASLCIDAGDNNSVSADDADLDGDGNTTEAIPFDLDGHPRIIDGDCNDTEVVDMGAYEFLELPEPNIAVSPLSHDFGNIELGTSSTVVVTISNEGSGDLTVSGIALETDFAITSVPPASVVVEPSETVDVEITYTPTVLGYNSAVLKITSDDPDEGVVEVALIGVGVSEEPPPDEQIAEILDFFDDSVADGNLAGQGPGESAERRLNALRNMLEAAGDLIEDELFEEACQQLADALKKTDGQPNPPDFVTGPAAEELAAVIVALRATLECE